GELVRAQDGDLAALERDARITLDVQEVRAPQMGVTLRLPRPDGCRIDGDLDVADPRIVRIEFEGALDLLEVPAHRRHHHVPHAESSRRMARLESPLAHDRPFDNLGSRTGALSAGAPVYIGTPSEATRLAAELRDVPVLALELGRSARDVLYL